MTTHIVFVLDESGSMSSIANDAVGGFNQFVAEQKTVPGKAKMSLIKFNSQVNRVFTDVKMKNVEPLALHESYYPSGMTALNDAIGMAINDKKGKKNVMIVVMTDGEENSSREFNNEMIKKEIKKHTKKGWEFMYLGANVDAFSEGSSRGFAANMSQDFTADAMGVRSAYAGASLSATAYRARVDSQTDSDQKAA